MLLALRDWPAQDSKSSLVEESLRGVVFLNNWRENCSSGLINAPPGTLSLRPCVASYSSRGRNEVTDVKWWQVQLKTKQEATHGTKSPIPKSHILLP